MQTLPKPREQLVSMKSSKQLPTKTREMRFAGFQQLTLSFWSCFGVANNSTAVLLYFSDPPWLCLHVWLIIQCRSLPVFKEAWQRAHWATGHVHRIRRTGSFTTIFGNNLSHCLKIQSKEKLTSLFFGGGVSSSLTWNNFSQSRPRYPQCRSVSHHPVGCCLSGTIPAIELFLFQIPTLSAGTNKRWGQKIGGGKHREGKTQSCCEQSKNEAKSAWLRYCWDFHVAAATGGAQRVHVVTSWVTKDGNENKERVR